MDNSNNIENYNTDSLNVPSPSTTIESDNYTQGLSQTVSNEDNRGIQGEAEKKSAVLGRIKRIAYGATLTLGLGALTACGSVSAVGVNVLPPESTYVQRTPLAEGTEEGISSTPDKDGFYAIQPTPMAPITDVNNRLMEDPTLTPTATVASTATPEATSTVSPTPTIEAEEPTIAPTFVIPPGEIGRNYFYFSESVYSYSNLQMIDFLDSRVEDVTVDGDFLVVSIRTLVRGEEVVLVSRTKGIIFEDYRGRSDGSAEYKFITVDNIEDIPRNVNIRPSYLYPVDRMSKERRDRIFITCESKKMSPEAIEARQILNPVCSNMELFDDMEPRKLDTVSLINWFSKQDSDSVDFNEVAILISLELH